MSHLKFTNVGKRKPSTMARAYVYAITAAMLEAQYSTEPEATEGWMFGGIEHEPDRRRLLKEIKRLEKEMLSRAAKLRTT